MQGRSSDVSKSGNFSKYLNEDTVSEGLSDSGIMDFDDLQDDFISLEDPPTSDE